jgi:hypothetical protein
LTPLDGKERFQAVTYEALNSLGINVDAVREMNLSPEELDDFYRRIVALLSKDDRSSKKSRNHKIHGANST